MAHVKRLCFAALATLLIVVTLFAAAATVADAKVTTTTAASLNSTDAPKVLWNVSGLGGAVTGSVGFDAATNHIFANSNEKITMLDARTGAKLKEAHYNGSATGASGVTIEGGFAFYMSRTGVFCRNATTFDFLWSFTRKLTQYFRGFSTLPPLYVASKNAVFVACAFESTLAYRFDAKTGKLTWEGKSSSVAYDSVSGVIYSEKHNLVMLGSANSAIGLHADTGKQVYAMITNGPVATGALSVDQEAVYFGGDGGLYSFHAATGKFNWLYIESQGVQGAPLLHKDVLYFIGNSWHPEKQGIYAVNAKTGKQLWFLNNGTRYTYENFPTFIPQLYGDTLLMAFDSVNHNYNSIAAVGLNGASVRWSFPLHTDSYQSFCYMQPTTDGKLFVGYGRDGLIALQLSPK